MSRSSSETQSLRRSAQPTRPCAEAHALPHAQRSSVSYALSPPRSHGTAPRPTGPLRRVPSLNLARLRSGSSRRSHAQRSAVAPAPRDAAPRARRRTLTHGVRRRRVPCPPWPRRHRPQSARSRHVPRLSRASVGDGHGPASAHAAAVTPRGMCAASAVHRAQRAPCPVSVRKLSPHVAYGLSPCPCTGACTRRAPLPALAHSYRSTPRMYAAIARAQYPRASPRRVRCVYTTSAVAGACRAPRMYAAIARAQNQCASYSRVQSFY